MNFIAFVNSNDQKRTSSRRVHSHAAKVAHAKSRQLRKAQYAKQNHQPTEPREDLSQSQGKYQPRKRVNATSGEDRQVSSAYDQDSTTLSLDFINGAFEHEPLAGFLRSLTALEHFMFNHCESLMPHSLCHAKANCRPDAQVVVPQLYEYCSIMTWLSDSDASPCGKTNWVLMASTEVELLHGFLLTASRHLSGTSPNPVFTEHAIQYKLRHVQSLRQSMLSSNPEAGRVAVTKALVLATDDVSADDSGVRAGIVDDVQIMSRDLPSASLHASAAVELIRAKGGPETLGLSPLICSLLYSHIFSKGLLGGTVFGSRDLLSKH